MPINDRIKGLRRAHRILITGQAAGLAHRRQHSRAGTQPSGDGGFGPSGVSMGDAGSVGVGVSVGDGVGKVVCVGTGVAEGVGWTPPSTVMKPLTVS